MPITSPAEFFTCTVCKCSFNDEPIPTSKGKVCSYCISRLDKTPDQCPDCFGIGEHLRASCTE